MCAALVAIGAAACGGDRVVDVAQECNPLGGAGCVTPWPSSIYEADDASTATGVRLDFPPGALPTNGDAVAVDPAAYNDRDGWSPASFAFTVLDTSGVGVDGSNLVHHDDIDASVTDASPTVLIDLTTGERVHHFAELDANAADFDLPQQALYIRPAGRLEPGHRYAAGVRTSLVLSDGSAIAVPSGFAALRDGRATEHERLERIRPGFADVLANFEAEGISADELVVAWDFTVASEEAITRTMLGARDAALDAMGPLAEEMTYTVTTDEPVDDGSQIARRIVGTFTAPQLIDDPDAEGARLVRDAGGAPMVVGTMDSKLVVQVPACAEAAAPVPVVVFGHGFFGDIKEAQAEYMSRVAEELCVIVAGTEWYGMNRKGVAGAALALNEASQLPGFGERVVQGIVNYITLEQLVRGKLATELIVDSTGASLVDSDRVYYYGISQGHVLGATFVAYDPFIERAVLAVGGTNWSLLFERSTNWPAFQLIISGAYEGPLNTVIIESLMQLALDPIENLHVTHHITGDPLPGAPPKQVMLHMAVGDSQVTNLSTEMQARVMDIPVLEPTVREPWGVTAAPGPLESGLVIYDEDPSPLPPESNLRNTTNNETHNNMRTRPAAIRQIGAFFDTGEIVNTCDGACDCAAGACE